MSQSQPPWDSLPVLALKSIYEHMRLQDVLAAASTCRHWRSALLMYDGVRSYLSLQIDEDAFKQEMLIRIFKKYLKRLHIYIDADTTQEAVNQFTLRVLTQFLDSIALEEIMIVGPVYMSQNKELPYIKLKRVIFETLVYKHANSMLKLGVFGCAINLFDETDRFTSSHMAHYSKTLTFKTPCTKDMKFLPPDPYDNSILSMDTVYAMPYTLLNHIVFEYELLSTESLVTLSEIEPLRLLSLNIMSKRAQNLPLLDWNGVIHKFRLGFEVAVNIIALSRHKVQHVISYAFTAGMPLASLKVMFCKAFYLPLVQHITMRYHTTLKEFSWVDRPSLGRARRNCMRLMLEDVGAGLHVNPFVYLAWQCKELRKLTIHGYWMCDYDIVGITRLREDIDIDVSAVYDSHNDGGQFRGEMYRVVEPPYYSECKVRLHRNTDGTVSCRTWHNLHEALKGKTTKKKFSQYIVSEIMNPMEGIPRSHNHYYQPHGGYP